MEIKDVIKRLSEINELITENIEDRERAAVQSEHCRTKEASDTSFQNYSSSGINIEQLMYEHSVLIMLLTENINKLDNILYRRILKKKYIDKKSAREIAKEIGYSYGYMCSLVSAAEQELQNILYDMS